MPNLQEGAIDKEMAFHCPPLPQIVMFEQAMSFVCIVVRSSGELILGMLEQVVGMCET